MDERIMMASSSVATTSIFDGMSFQERLDEYYERYWSATSVQEEIEENDRERRMTSVVILSNKFPIELIRVMLEFDGHDEYKYENYTAPLPYYENIEDLMIERIKEGAKGFNLRNVVNMAHNTNKIMVSGGGLMNGNAMANVERWDNKWYYVEYGGNPVKYVIGTHIVWSLERPPRDRDTFQRCFNITYDEPNELDEMFVNLIREDEEGFDLECWSYDSDYDSDYDDDDE